MSHSLHLSHSCETELVSASCVQPPADAHTHTHTMNHSGMDLIIMPQLFRFALPMTDNVKCRIESLVEEGFSDGKSEGTPLSASVFTETAGKLEVRATSGNVFLCVCELRSFYFVRLCSLTCCSFGFLASSVEYFKNMLVGRHLAGQEHGV